MTTPSCPPGVFLPVQYSTVQYSTTPPRFHHRGVGPAPAGEPPFTMRKEGLGNTAVAMLMKLALTTLAVSHTLVRNVAVIKPMMRIDEFGQYDEHRDVWLQRLADAHARANAKRAELEAKTRQEAGEERTTLAMRVSPMVETTADEIAMLRRAHELTRNLRQNLNQLQEAEHGLAVRGLLTSGQNKFRSLLRLVLSGLSDRSETQRRAILIRPEVRSGFDEHRRYKLDQEYTH